MTVKMKKGNKYADIFDSPETIRQAQMEGYSLVETRKAEPKPVTETEEKNEAPAEEKKPSRTKRQ